MANVGYCTHLCQNIGIYVYVNIYLYIIHAYIYVNILSHYRSLFIPSMATYSNKYPLLRHYNGPPGQHARAASQKRHRAGNPESNGIS
jgi:hypothetical protein